MTWGAVLLAYLAGCLLAVLPLARWFAADLRHRGLADQPGDWTAAALMAICLAGMWPLLIPAMWIGRILRRDAERDRSAQ